MSRLPTIGSDTNAWGAILNDFLSVAHNADGSLKNIYNIAQYGPVDPFGTSKSTTAITNAINAAIAAGGGIIFSPPGTYITDPQTLATNIAIIGCGPGITTWKLADGSNADLLSANTSLINFSQGVGLGDNGGIHNFIIRDITLDGNSANQSGTSYVLRFYGFGYLLDNVHIQNSLNEGIFCDWNGSVTTVPDNMEAKLCNLKIHNNGGTGLKFGGPHDSQWVNILSFRGKNAFHLGPHASATTAVNCHGYSVATGINAVAWLIESSQNLFLNCQGEGSDTMQVVINSFKNVWQCGHIFSPTASPNGLQLGQQASLTPFYDSVFQSAGVTTAQSVTACIIDSLWTDCTGANGAIFFANSAGKNIVRGMCSQTSGSAITGTPSFSDRLDVVTQGLAADGTIAKGGECFVGIDSTTAFAVRDGANAIFNVNTHSGSRRVELSNGTALRLYSDGFTTRTVEISGGTISLLPSTSAAATATAGTITTSGVGIARVAPTGNITGVILQAGTLDGQTVIVRNESTFTVTFAASGTSFVADGVSDVIAANHSAMYTYSVSNALWSRV